MAAPSLTPDQWTELRRASEAGMSDEDLASAYGVSRGAIRLRRMREQWITPKVLAKEVARQELENRFKRIPSNGVTNSGGVTSETPAGETPRALTLTAQTMVQRAQEGTLAAVEMFADAIMRAHQRGGIATPTDGKELMMAMKGARLGAGLDREGTTINIAAFWRPERDAAPTYEAEILDAS